MSVRIFISAVIFFLSSWAIYAQVQVSLQMKNDSVIVGEDLDLIIRIKPEDQLDITSMKIQVFDSLGLVKYLFPEDTSLQSLVSIPVDYEISNYGEWSETGTTVLGDGSIPFEAKNSGEILNTISIKIWDPGNFMILVGEMKTLSTDGISGVYFPEIRHAQVITVIEPKDLLANEIEMRPIKDILREGWHWLDFKWLYIAVLVIALLVFILNRPLFRKKTKDLKKQEIIVQRPAHEIALEKLMLLNDDAIWKKGDIKGYQTALSFIVREYLENRFSIKALESTTREIIWDLASSDLQSVDIDNLKDLLQIADLVKFAKAEPDEDIHQQFLDMAIEFVNRTKNDEQNSSETG